jgi:hypothetical protein
LDGTIEFRRRFRMRIGCRVSTDSATTARRPPEFIRRTMVTIKWTKTTRMSYLRTSYQNLKKRWNSGPICNSPPTGAADCWGCLVPKVDGEVVRLVCNQNGLDITTVADARGTELLRFSHGARGNPNVCRRGANEKQRLDARGRRWSAVEFTTKHSVSLRA